MPARLVPLIAGSAPTISLHRPVLLIGRHPDCDVRLDLPAISRRHCCVALAYDRLTIRDLGSRHGTRVNGALIEESRLVPGDEIAIGPLIYRFDDPTAIPAAPPARPQAASRTPEPDDDSDDDLIPLSGLFPEP